MANLEAAGGRALRVCLVLWAGKAQSCTCRIDRYFTAGRASYPQAERLFHPLDPGISCGNADAVGGSAAHGRPLPGGVAISAILAGNKAAASGFQGPK
jgi:hypothetical protein